MKNKFLFWLCLAAQLFILLILQGTAVIVPEICGGRPLLLLSLAFSVFVLEDEISSAAVGAVCGAFTDLAAYGKIGFFAVLLTLCGFFASAVFKKYLVPSALTVFLVSLVCTATVLSLYFCVFAIQFNFADSGAYFVRHYISKIIYTAAVSVPLFRLNAFLIMRKRGRDVE